MSIGSDIRGKLDELDTSPVGQRARFSSNVVPYVLSTSDAFVIMLASVVAGIVYQSVVGNPSPKLIPHCAVGLLASFIHILRMSGGGYYDFPASAMPNVEFSEILICWFSTGLMLAFFAFLLKIGVDYSRGAFVLFYFVTPIGLLSVRKVTKVVLARAVSRGAVGRNDIVLVGDVDEIEALETRDLVAFFGATEIKCFPLSGERDMPARAVSDAGVFNAITSFVRRNDCREVVLAVPWTDTARLDFLRDQIKTLPVAARLLPDARVRSLTNYTSSGRQRVLAIEIQRAPLSGLERFIKRAMDIVFASLSLIFFASIMLLTAIAIKLDSPGPIIFKQKRKGFNGKQFVMFKFRTMTVQENGDTVVQATRDDPRVTSIGSLLRAASIDELPQLVNVLMGEMSLIGPRPHALAHDNYFEKVLGDYAYRHHVKPGMTGWAQINGARGATPTVEHIAERVKLDLWYINNWSLWLDVQILIKTFFEVLRKRNAY